MRYLVFSLMIFYSISSYSRCDSFTTCPKSSITSKSVVLFGDFNDAKKTEINCARKAACERGQKLVVFPALGLNTAESTKLKDNFDETITALEKDGLSVQAMILSGHDGGSTYGGKRGQIDYSEFEEVLQKHPKTKDGIESYFGWGCYTGTINEVNNKWKHLLPNMKLMVGFDLKAPLSNVPSGYQFLYDALVSEEDLRKEEDAQALADAVRLLSSADQLNLSTYLRKQCFDSEGNTRTTDEFYFGKNKTEFIYPPGSMSDALKTCQTYLAEAKRLTPVYHDVVSGVLPVPIRSSSNPSDLRKLYEAIRLSEACNEHNDEPTSNTEEYEKLYSPDADSVIHLIYDDYLMNNFFNSFDKDLITFEKELKELLPNEDISSMTPKRSDLKNASYRKIITEKLFKLNKLFADIPHGAPNSGKLFDLSMAVMRMEAPIMNQVVPASWRDSKNSAEKLPSLFKEDDPGKMIGDGTQSINGNQNTNDAMPTDN